MRTIYDKRALRELNKLDRETASRIMEKLEFYARAENPRTQAKKLVINDYGQWRFRVGDYRILCDITEDQLIVYAVGHRRQIYR